MTTTTLAGRAAPLPNLRLFAAVAAIGLAAAGVLVLERNLAASRAPAAAVARIVAETCEAFRIGDAAALDRLLDARYTLVGANGEVSGKAEQLANARALQQPGTVRVRDVEVRVDGDTAVAIGVLALRGADGAPRTLRFTETLVAGDGTWRVAATHISSIRN